MKLIKIYKPINTNKRREQRKGEKERKPNLQNPELTTVRFQIGDSYHDNHHQRK
jgi:hypothetical protein